MVQRVDVYYDKNKGVKVKEYSWTGDGENKRLYISNSLQGRSAEQYMSNLASSLKIVNIAGYNGYIEKIFYEDGRYVDVVDGDALIEAGLLYDYFCHVKDYYDKKKRTTAPKVTRKNKYTGRKIIATGLVALALIFVVRYCSLHSTETEEPEVTSDLSGETLDEPSVIFPESTTFEDTLIVTTPEYTTKGPETVAPSLTTFPETIEKVPITESVDVDAAFVDYEVRTDFEMEKLEKTRNLYGELIQKYSKMYGLDYNLVLALATQERGEHSPVRDPGGATGLMQIQNGVWVDEELTAYNFETQKNETVYITKDMLSDCETNIKLGCMILQDMLRLNRYNLLMGIQAYNFGTDGVKKAINAYLADIGGVTFEDVRANQNDSEWLNYRDTVNHGDPLYLEHIFSYMGKDIVLEFYKPDGTLVTCNVRNYQNTRSR